MTPIYFLCLSCKHFYSFHSKKRQEINKLGFYCDAYPKSSNGIPKEIIYSRTDHRQPYKGDHGIRFELDKKKKKEDYLPFMKMVGWKK